MLSLAATPVACIALSESLESATIWKSPPSTLTNRRSSVSTPTPVSPATKTYRPFGVIASVAPKPTRPSDSLLPLTYVPVGSTATSRLSSVPMTARLYWAMVLPYIAGGQVFAIFVLKGFFDGLPEDLFEAARIDGAGHFAAYRHIVLPLSKPVLSVVLIMNVLGTWNNFLWPFIVNSEGRYHVVASGLYVLATSTYSSDIGTLFAAYVLSSIPLLILFVYATRPFIQGVTSGAFKA